MTELETLIQRYEDISADKSLVEEELETWFREHKSIAWIGWRIAMEPRLTPENFSGETSSQ